VRPRRGSQWFASAMGCSPAPWDALQHHGMLLANTSSLIVGLLVDGVLVVNLLLSNVLILFY
jgi:hypothetical protein